MVSNVVAGAFEKVLVSGRWSQSLRVSVTTPTVSVTVSVQVTVTLTVLVFWYPTGGHARISATTTGVTVLSKDSVVGRWSQSDDDSEVVTLEVGSVDGISKGPVQRVAFPARTAKGRPRPMSVFMIDDFDE